MSRFTSVTEAVNCLPPTCRQSGIMYRCVDTGNLYLIETLASGEINMRMMVVGESIELMKPTKPCFQLNMTNLIEEYIKNPDPDTEYSKIFNDLYYPKQNG